MTWITPISYRVGHSPEANKHHTDSFNFSALPVLCQAGKWIDAALSWHLSRLHSWNHHEQGLLPAPSALVSYIPRAECGTEVSFGKSNFNIFSMLFVCTTRWWNFPAALSSLLRLLLSAAEEA